MHKSFIFRNFVLFAGSTVSLSMFSTGRPLFLPEPLALVPTRSSCLTQTFSLYCLLCSPASSLAIFFLGRGILCKRMDEASAHKSRCELTRRQDSNYDLQDSKCKPTTLPTKLYSLRLYFENACIIFLLFSSRLGIGRTVHTCSVCYLYPKSKHEEKRLPTSHKFIAYLFFAKSPLSPLEFVAEPCMVVHGHPKTPYTDIQQKLALPSALRGVRNLPRVSA